MHKIRTHHSHPQGRIFSWMSLIMFLGIGLVSPILPNFIKDILQSTGVTSMGPDTAVSLFFSAMAMVMFIGAILSTVIFKKIKRTKITKLSFLVLGIIYLLYILVTQFTHVAILESARVCFKLFLLMALGLFVRDFSKAKDLGEEEGIFYKFTNIGLFIGPLLGGFLAAKFGYEIVFIMSAATMLFGFAYFSHKHIVEKHPAIVKEKKVKTKNILQNIKKFFSNSGRTKAYFITIIHIIWTSFKHLYIPLYVATSIYAESMSGLILAIGIIPLILLEVHVGKYAEKKGVRFPISIGFLLMAIVLLIAFLSQSHELNFILLMLVSIGSAFVEPLQEYILFKNLPKSEEDELYGIYMTADPIAYFMVPAIGAVVLFFLPFNYLFLIFGIIFLLAGVFSWITLKHL